MAFDAFIKLDGGPKVEGESKQKGFEKQIEIYSFSWGASNPATVGQGSGGGAGKVSISSFNVMKKTDLASGPLFQTCCQGDHFDTAVVTLRKAGGTAALNYLTYEFEEIYVDSIQWSGSSGGDDTPTESVSFSFGKVTITYTEQTAKGTGGKTTGGSWDVRTGTK